MLSIPNLLIFLSIFQQIHPWCLFSTTSYSANISSIEYSTDRSLFITTNSQGIAQLWSAPNKLIITSITPASGTATNARFNKNNTQFAISTSTSMIYFYNSTPPYVFITSINTGLGSGSTTIDFSFDGGYILICGGNTNTAKVYNLTTYAMLTSVSFSNAQTCKFAANSNFAIAAATSSNFNYYTITGGSVWSQSYNSCFDIDFDGTSSTVVMSCNNGANKKGYASSTTTPSSVTVHTGSALMRTAQITPDGAYIAYSGDQKILIIVNKTGTTYTVQYQYALDSQAYSSDFSSDSSYLLVGTKLGFIYQYSRYCLNCKAGTYQNLTTLNCQSCSLYNRACGLCANSTYCIECSQGYHIENILTAFTGSRGCTACSLEGCIVCNSSIYCIRCQVGYYVTSGICKACSIAIPGCLRCNSSSICQSCSHQYYVNSNDKCSLCTGLTGCSLCATSSYCHVCQVGYYFNGGNCNTCPTNCLACYNTTTCQDCRQGYYPTNTAGATCSLCPTTGCLSCNQTGYCYQCQTGRYFDPATGTCPTCTYPCNQCNGTICTNCQPGFYLDYAALNFTSASSGGQCTQCVFPCITCNSSTYCLSCPIGYYLISNNTCITCDNLQTFCSQCTPTVCLNCTLGYYLNASNLCTSCTINMYACVSCTSISTCTRCAPSYYLTTNTGSNSCGVCPQGCQLCNSTTYCYGCIDGFYIDINNTNLCKRCVPPCTICTNSSICLQCQQQYYLNGTSCIGCVQNITNCIACDDQTGVIKCVSCKVGYFVNNGACTMCTLPCLVCSSASVCGLCQIGYYLLGSTCTLCVQNCTACTSASVCTSCSIGFYLNTTDKKCYHCSAIGCLTCNTSLSCLSCVPGYWLSTAANNTCLLCSTSIKYCQLCINSTYCKSCSFGYTLNSNYSACTVCSTIQGCYDCSNLLSCDVCQTGYYWDNSTGNGLCYVCPYGCLTCTNNVTCATCLPGYVLNSTSCILCQDILLGCQLCNNSNTCIQCYNGYYLNNGTCTLCRSVMKGCQYCNSSSICTYCSIGYYLLTPNNTCQICTVTLQGCQTCKSNSICIDCQNGYYLSGNSCLFCQLSLPGCITCSNNNTCTQCLTSYALNITSNICTLCKTNIIGCISCTNLSICNQCQSGYYLRSTDYQCIACNQTGCQICYQNNTNSCVTCNTMYYLFSNTTNSICYYCADYIQGCIQCTTNITCTLCNNGYFINSSNLCQLCQSVIQGCSLCTNISNCYSCKSTYYLNTTTYICQTCLSAMIGCAYCLDLSQCIACSNGYYKNITTGYCQLCIKINGCLACSNSTTCLVCQGDYYLTVVSASQVLCYPCNIIPGCYSCIDNNTCVVCIGGYVLNDNKLCQVFRVLADQAVQGMKMVSQYIDQNTLSHILYAQKIQYNISNYTIQQWRNTTNLTLQYPNFTISNLTISSATFVKNNQLQFYTNNPLNVSMSTLPARRMLSAMPQGYLTFINMKQAMVNSILPDLYMSHNLVMNYDLTQPQFYTSIYVQKFSLIQSAIGIVVIVILMINYVIKAVVTCPHQAISQYGQILPHFQALKAPIFVIYPLFPQQISFCFGFMAAQLPWARYAFSNALSDKSQTMPTQYSVLYDSLSFSSTYMLPFIIIIALVIVMWLYKKNNQKNTKTTKTKNQKLKQQQPLKPEQQNSQWGFPQWPLKMVFYNLFYFGLVFNSSASIQNVIYNPAVQINISSLFNVIGIVCFGLCTTDCFYSLYQNPLYFYKLRIYIKAILLSISHLSPIYIFSSTLILDLLCLIIQYRLTRDNKSYPKLWLYNNFIINLSLGLLVFIHQHYITMIIVGIMLFSIIIIEFYVHYQDYLIEKKKSRFMMPKQFKLNDQNQEIGKAQLNIWNIDFNKQEQKNNNNNNNNMNKMRTDDIDNNIKNNDKKQSRYERRQRKQKKYKNNQNLKILQNYKEDSLQNIHQSMMTDNNNNISNNNNNNNNDHTFVAADFVS